MIPLFSNGPQQTVLRALLNRRCQSLNIFPPLQTRARHINTTKQPNHNSKPSSTSEINQDTPLTPVLFHLKQKALPYWHLARLDKPIGTVLLFLPCTWSITMASYATTASPYILGSNLFLFGMGAVLLRGAGCVINDLWDRNLDKGVERTRSRPLASGALSTRQAVGFLGLQLAGGLVILTQLNWFSIGLGASSLGLVAIYPFMKRITHWPQAVLGLTFNWGALLGWSAVTGGLDWAVCAPLYLSGILWTLVYDTAYAHQDKRDDAIMGIKSTALLFGDRTKIILAMFLVASALSVGWAGIQNNQDIPFFACVSLGTALLGLKLHRVNFNIPQDCNMYFRYCGYFGWFVFAGALLDWMFAYYTQKRHDEMNTKGLVAPALGSSEQVAN